MAAHCKCISGPKVSRNSSNSGVVRAKLAVSSQSAVRAISPPVTSSQPATETGSRAGNCIRGGGGGGGGTRSTVPLPTGTAFLALMPYLHNEPELGLLHNFVRAGSALVLIWKCQWNGNKTQMPEQPERKASEQEQRMASRCGATRCGAVALKP